MVPYSPRRLPHSIFIRSREEDERHLEVRVGNVETAGGVRQVFGAVAKAGTDISALIRLNLGAVGGTDTTVVTAFTDGCPGLRSALVDAGVTRPPILEWFHIAMRLQHATQAAPIGRRGCATSLLDWHEMFWTRHSEAIILFHCV